jgi:uncharacterized OB-fold protein
VAHVPEAAQLSFIADGLIGGAPDAPRLIGSGCRLCGTVAFPSQSSCPRCTSQETEEHLLARTGTLWTWTIQGFAPKPPYAGDRESFVPYGVGYVELAGEVRVEARLRESDPERLQIGMEMELVLEPAPGHADDGVMTFAFAPIEGVA